ncbi:hypothetical protein [Sphingobacterium sp. HMA12]|uniref:hypothetical protein n=1 Tax=Sphingobacterium sp. HMA12 TaxID=2050894 RepID=UPI001315704D|nr:hypothetical protein [Sphingobacterium sp. HMA12]
MTSIYYIYISAAVSMLIIALYTFITAKNITKIKKYRYLVISLVGLFLSTAITINLYYDDIFKEDSKNIKKIINTTFSIDTNKSIDSLDEDELRLLIKQNQRFIDSINKQNKLLLQYKNNIENIEKIIGSKNETKSEIGRKLNNNTDDLNVIQKYNKKLSNSIAEKRKGTTFSGTSDKFIFNCPTNLESDTLELSLKFIDENIIEEIAYISISFSEQKNPKNYVHISEEFYEAQKGVNLFKVKNVFKNNSDKKILLEIGYTLKSESKKEFPRIEKATCRNF